MNREELLKEVSKEFGPGCASICKERARQIEVKGYDINRDVSFYRNRELALAACSYALEPKTFTGSRLFMWPWDREMYNPTPENRKREFEKAGALLAAQIDVEESNQ